MSWPVLFVFFWKLVWLVGECKDRTANLSEWLSALKHNYGLISFSEILDKIRRTSSLNWGHSTTICSDYISPQLIDDWDIFSYFK